MSTIRYGLEFACDVCGAHQRITSTDTTPEGWTDLTSFSLSISLPRGGARITHLCPTCSGLSIGELSLRLHALALAARQQPEAEGDY